MPKGIRGRLSCLVVENGELCGRPLVIEGMCKKHGSRLRATGDPLVRKLLVPAADRFWEKVDKNGPVSDYRPDLGQCWVWVSPSVGKGYGYFSSGVGKERQSWRVHVWSWVQVNGPVPEGLELDHLCRVTLCVRPLHLEAVTHLENVRRGTAGRWLAERTHCIHDHEFTSENTYITPSGCRSCRTCSRENQRRYRAAS